MAGVCIRKDAVPATPVCPLHASLAAVVNEGTLVARSVPVRERNTELVFQQLDELPGLLHGNV